MATEVTEDASLEERLHLADVLGGQLVGLVERDLAAVLAESAVENDRVVMRVDFEGRAEAGGPAQAGGRPFRTSPDLGVELTNKLGPATVDVVEASRIPSFAVPIKSAPRARSAMNSGMVLRYLVIDTRKWWPGRKVVVSSDWVEQISWSESTVYFDLTRETIKRAPEYTELPALRRDYETALHH